ncbi:MAG: hypothetical protein COT17_06525 [Elusimicrobia bacterium CG08_land_8_20_14_0_20_51_18]|nr:MAG: hypothetical protein COT17_06525 [Elusimicrobia bacterium CG08_land_8_20_14_0_20_51_18]
MNRQRSLVNYFFISLALFSLLLLIFPTTKLVHSAKLFSGYVLKPEFNYLSRYENVLKKIPSRVKNLVESDIRNRELGEKIKKLEIDLIHLKSLEGENERLKNALALSKRLYYKGVFARIISRNPANAYNSFFIDKGARHFIREGYPVIGFSGESYALIGRIFDVYDEYSKVILVNNPQFSFIGSIGGQGIDVLVKGNNSGRLSVDYINSRYEVRIGDQLRTSPSSITFPPWLPIGKIGDIYKGKSSMNFYGAGADQAVKLESVKEVYVMEYDPPIKIEEEGVQL